MYKNQNEKRKNNPEYLLKLQAKKFLLKMLKQQETTSAVKKLENQNKHKSTTVIKKNYGNPEKSPIAISYRAEKEGGAAFYDHYTTQCITNHPTGVSYDSDNFNVTNFVEYTSYSKLLFKFGESKKPIDGKLKTSKKCSGLFLIPSWSRESEDTVDLSLRCQYENNEINRARLTGQPVLAIGSGAWTLWKNFGGKLCTTYDHTALHMPSLKPDGNVGYNIQVHKIVIADNTILQGAAKNVSDNNNGDFLPSVNSTHWYSFDENHIPDLIDISALSLEDAKIAPKKSNGDQMRPPETIEAFETKYGTPMVGIQWRPEAYNESDKQELNPKFHRNIIKHMAQAGDAFNAKRRMLKQFNQIVKETIADSLANQGIFTQTKNNKGKRTEQIIHANENSTSYVKK